MSQIARVFDKIEQARWNFCRVQGVRSRRAKYWSGVNSKWQHRLASAIMAKATRWNNSRAKRVMEGDE